MHVTEEARHLHFAELYLREHLPRCSAFKRQFIPRALPFILREAQRRLLLPSPALVERHRVPRSVLATCFGRGSTHRAEVEQVAGSLFALLGPSLAATARVWR